MNDPFFLTLVDAMPAGVVVLDQVDGAVRYINPHAAALLGVDAQRCVGRALSASLPEHADAWIALLRRAQASVDVSGPLEGYILALAAFEPAPGQLGILIHDVSARCDLGDPRTPASTLLAGLGDGQRVLLVEDQTVNRVLATRILESAGFEVIQAEDGVAALEVLDQSHIDLVLMDCDMPRMDGLAATRSLRAREARRGGGARIPVIALTARAGAADQAACLAAGMDDFMSKPYMTFELLERVHCHLARAQRCDQPTPSSAAMSNDAAASEVSQAAASATDQAATLDMRVIDELREVLGDDLNEIFGQFLFQLDDQVQRIGAALTTGDAQRVRESAHAVKGCAANLGVSALAAIAATIESRAREGDLASAAQSFATLPPCAAHSVAMLAELGFSASET